MSGHDANFVFTACVFTTTGVAIDNEVGIMATLVF